MRPILCFLLLATAIGCDSESTRSSVYTGVLPAGAEARLGTIWIAAAHLKVEPNSEYIPALYAFTPTRFAEPKLVREYYFERTRAPGRLPRVAAGLEFSDETTLPTLWTIDGLGNLARFRPDGKQSFFYFAELASTFDAMRVVPLTNTRRWIFLFSREPRATGIVAAFIDLMDGETASNQGVPGAFGGACGEWGYCWLAAEVGSGVRLDAVGVSETLDLARTEFSISTGGRVRSEICGGADGFNYFIAGEELVGFNFETHEVVRSEASRLAGLPADTFLTCGPASSNGQVWAAVSEEPAAYHKVNLAGGGERFPVAEGTVARFPVALEDAFYLIDGRRIGKMQGGETCGSDECTVVSTTEIGMVVEKVEN